MNGYLRRDVENIVDDLAFGAGIEVDDEKIESLLRVVQRFDPAGVGARDLRECLFAAGETTLGGDFYAGFGKMPGSYWRVISRNSRRNITRRFLNG